MTYKNKKELLRRVELYRNQLVNLGVVPFNFGSKKKRDAYFQLFIELNDALIRWSPKV